MKTAEERNTVRDGRLSWGAEIVALLPWCLVAVVAASLSGCVSATAGRAMEDLQRALDAAAQGMQDAMRLPEGYSDPIPNPKIPHAVLVTAGFAEPNGLGTIMSSDGAKQQMQRAARVSVIRVLLEGGTFQRILPTEDGTSPLLTDDTLLLHISAGRATWTGRTTSDSTRMTTAYTGFLRRRDGKQAMISCEVHHDIHAGAQDLAAMSDPENMRRQQAEHVTRIREGLEPQILAAYEKLQ